MGGGEEDPRPDPQIPSIVNANLADSILGGSGSISGLDLGGMSGLGGNNPYPGLQQYNSQQYGDGMNWSRLGGQIGGGLLGGLLGIPGGSQLGGWLGDRSGNGGIQGSIGDPAPWNAQSGTTNNITQGILNPGTNFDPLYTPSNRISGIDPTIYTGGAAFPTNGPNIPSDVGGLLGGGSSGGGVGRGGYRPADRPQITPGSYMEQALDLSRVGNQPTPQRTGGFPAPGGVPPQVGGLLDFLMGRRVG